MFFFNSFKNRFEIHMVSLKKKISGYKTGKITVIVFFINIKQLEIISGYNDKMILCDFFL